MAEEYVIPTTTTPSGERAYQTVAYQGDEVAWGATGRSIFIDSFTASDQGIAVHQNESTTTLTLTLTNQTASAETLRVSLREDGTEFDTQTLSVGASSSNSVSVDRSYTTPQEHTYAAVVTGDALAVALSSGRVPVRWYDETAAWDNIEVPVTIENTGANFGTPNTTTFSADVDQTADGYLEEPAGLDGVIKVLWEDGGGTPRDERIVWDNEPADNVDFVTIEVFHRKASAYEHELWFGTNKNFSVGAHDTDSSEDTFERVFAARAYDDGRVTDLAGQTILGTWK